MATLTHDAIAGSGEVIGRESEIEPSKNHYSRCGNFPLECVNRCGKVSIKGMTMRRHRLTCPMERVKCPYNATLCGNDILQKDLEGHKLHCEHRLYRCRYCFMKSGTYKSITGIGESALKGECHYDVCGQYLLQCPNKCGKQSIKRKIMPLHRERCPLEKLDCPFKYVGCSLPVLHKNMDRHCNKGIQNHLLLVAEAHQKLAGKCEELTQKNEGTSS